MFDVVEQKRTLFRFLYLSFSIIIAVSFLFILLAMIFYPGGNRGGFDVSGYSLLYNGLCDMKDPLALNGDPNLLSSILLKIGIVLFSFATLLFFSSLPLFFQSRTSTKYVSIVGAFFGIAQAPLFILVFFLQVPYEIHMIFVVIAPLFQYLAVILFAIVYFIDKKFPSLINYSFLILAVVSIVLSILVGIANGIGGTFNVVTQRLGTNLFNFLTIIIYIIQGLGLFFYLKKTNEFPAEQ